MLTVILVHDCCDLDDINGVNQWTLYSFCNRHKNFKHPDDFEVIVSRNHIENVRNQTLRRKLKNGLAHWLSYYEHGASYWMRKDGSIPLGVEFQWDGVRVAGLLVWENKATDLGLKTFEDRAKDADTFIKSYNSVINGEYLYYIIENENGDIINSCGGFYDSDHMLEEISHYLIGHDFRVKSDLTLTHLEDDLRKVVAGGHLHKSVVV